MGEGWAPALLNNRNEMNFIKQGQKSFSDKRSFWIGGRTNTQPGDFFEYSDYNPIGLSTSEFNESNNAGVSFFNSPQLKLTCQLCLHVYLNSMKNTRLTVQIPLVNELYIFQSPS